MTASIVLAAGALLLAACGSTDSADSADSVAPATANDSANPTTDTDDGDAAATTPATAATTAETAAPEPTVDPNVPELPDRGPNPGLVDLDGWLNAGDVTSLDDLKGQVVAVQFWTFGCRNCKATLPHVKELQEKYGDQGFTIVGVHAPEFDFEADPDNISQAIVDLDVTWPVALDTEKKNFRGWQEGTRSFWPRIYLLDRDGHIRYDHIGEGSYDEIDAAVGALLAEN